MLAKAFQEGCVLHRLLPRVLARLSGDGGEQGLSAAMRELLNDADVSGEADNAEDGVDGNDKATWESILADLAGCDQALSPAEVNRKRKQLTFAAFRDPLMVSKALAVEALIAPNVRQMHTLFKRSSIVAELQMLPSTSPFAQTKIPALREECFCHY